MKKATKVFLAWSKIGLSGIFGVILTLVYQHIFPSNSFTLIYNGEEVHVDEKIYSEIVSLNEILNEKLFAEQNQVDNLVSKLNTKQEQIEAQKLIIDKQNSEEEVRKIIQDATDYWNKSNCVQALTLLKNTITRSSDIELLYEQYSNEYVINLLLQSDELLSEKNYDTAVEELQNGKDIVSDDSMLNNKINEINNIISNKQPIELSEFKITANRFFNQIEEEFILDTIGNKYFKGNLFDIYADGKTNYGYATFYLGQKYTSLSGKIAVSDESGDYEGWIEIGYRKDDKFNSLWTSPKLGRITSILLNLNLA